MMNLPKKDKNEGTVSGKLKRTCKTHHRNRAVCAASAVDLKELKVDDISG